MRNTEHDRELVELESYLAAAVTRVDTGSSYGYWDREDLVQEAYLKLFLVIDKFDGRSSLRTWAYRVAANRARDMSKRARYTNALISRFDAGHESDTDGPEENIRSRDLQSSKKAEIKEQIVALLSMLKEDDTIHRGWEVMTLLFKNGGDRREVASAMSVLTGSKWSMQRVSKVVRSVSKTPQGKLLCGAM